MAAESFGVRSMCTLVETPDITVLLDAGISLCSIPLQPATASNRVPNHRSSSKKNCRSCRQSPITTISHYHFDHHTPSFEDWVVNWTEDGETARQIYQDKIVLAKNSKEKINASQRQRAWMFQKTGGKHAKMLEAADNELSLMERRLCVFLRL